ncbi:MAG: PBP1A family penicillin-binding protein [Lachnospiraceae bacterium]|nr:PBP1A family penicillin-binding protein [Lachnospiraceae bacterium]
MDYTKTGLEKKEARLSGTSQSREMRAGLIVIRVLLFALIACVVIAVCGITGVIKGIIANAPDIDNINIQPSGFATFIYDSDGNQLQKLTSADSNRTAVSLDNVPVVLQHAVVAIEDERFYQHKGVDPRGIVRATIIGLTHGMDFSQGASTITQQLLKNNVFTNWTKETKIDRIKRKLQEQYLAVELEKKLNDKDLILENYLNTINLGAGTYGVEAAARQYFNKDVWDLNLSESAVLAGITQNPARYNPITHPDYNATRRKTVLSKMLELGYITEDEMNAALADDVYTEIANAQDATQTTSKVYTYFIDETIQQVVEDLQKQKGYTENQAYQAVYSGGLRIYTTQDSNIQNIVDEEYNDPDNFPNGTTYSMDWALSVRDENGTVTNYSREMLEQYYKENLPADQAAAFDLNFDSAEEGQSYIDDYKSHVVKATDTIIAERTSFAPQPQSSMVVMDQKTGYVKAIEGGRGTKTASRTMNRATNTYRQPGSTFKIVSTYAPLLDSGQKTLASVYKDEPYYYANGGQEVHNASNTYGGWTTIRNAIIHSVNVVAVKAITDLTPKAAYNELLKFGFTSLDPAKDVYQPLALGGISKGVSNLELTAAYAAIANEGTYTKPIFYTKILDRNNNVIIDNTPETSKVVSKDTAWLLTSAMEDVVTQGTGTACQLDNGMPVAGKTGTTSAYNDLWFVGYSPYYTIGVWSGYDDNTKIPDSGIYREYHKILWKKVMERLTDEKKIVEFTKPDTVQQVTICGRSNEKPTGYCDQVFTEYVAGDMVPTTKCTICKNKTWSSSLGDYIYNYEDDATANADTYTNTEEGNDGNEAGYNADDYTDDEDTVDNYGTYGNDDAGGDGDTEYNYNDNTDYDTDHTDGLDVGNDNENYIDETGRDENAY